MASELKPCPFCGGGQGEWKCGMFYGRIECIVCHCKGPETSYKATAIMLWNTRAPEQQQSQPRSE